MPEQQEKKETAGTTAAMIVCKADGSKCSICGAFIPDADFACANGHMLGRTYEVPDPDR